MEFDADVCENTYSGASKEIELDDVVQPMKHDLNAQPGNFMFPLPFLTASNRAALREPQKTIWRSLDSPDQFP